MHLRSLATFTLLTTIAVAQVPPYWVQSMPTTSPAQRRDGAMAWDATANRLLMYGGVTQTPSAILSETWSYNGQWTLLALSPTAAGAPRWGHRMVRNPTSNHLITFGGRAPTINGFSDDTSEWNGTAWVPVLTPTAPSPRYLYAMAFDSHRGVAVLFGGHSSSSTLSDTWEYDGVTWTQRPFTNGPSARQDAVMVYDSGLGRCVLFGGREPDLGIVLGDTWLYDGTTWFDATPPQSPSPRFRAGAAFDSTRQRTVVYGGFDGTVLRDDTYEFTGSDWLLITPTTPDRPTNESEAYAGYDPVRKKFVLFGGFGGVFTNETWEFTGSNAGVFSTFGLGCTNGAGAAPVLTGSTPTLGQPLQLTLTTNPTSVASLAIWAVGLSNTTWQGLPLPLDLAVIGLPACNLYVAADFLDVSLIVANTTNYSINVPNLPSLLNATLFVQGLTSDLSLTFVGVTPGGRAVLGS